TLNNYNVTDEQQDQLLLTTIGKIIFNEILPDSFPYINKPTKTNLEDRTPEKYFVEKGTNVKEEIGKREEVKPFKKGFLGDIIAEMFKRFKSSETSKMRDRLKDLGFSYSTRAG